MNILEISLGTIHVYDTEYHMKFYIALNEKRKVYPHICILSDKKKTMISMYINDWCEYCNSNIPNKYSYNYDDDLPIKFRDKLDFVERHEIFNWMNNNQDKIITLWNKIDSRYIHQIESNKIINSKMLWLCDMPFHNNIFEYRNIITPEEFYINNILYNIHAVQMHEFTYIPQLYDGTYEPLAYIGNVKYPFVGCYLSLKTGRIVDMTKRQYYPSDEEWERHQYERTFTHELDLEINDIKRKYLPKEVWVKTLDIMIDELSIHTNHNNLIKDYSYGEFLQRR